MRLRSLSLAGFRCFGPTPTLIRFSDRTVLIGPNGAGKSAVLLALLRLFGVTTYERSLVREDFHVAPGVDAGTVKQLSLTLEATFDFPELSNDVKAWPKDGVATYFRHLTVQEPGGPPFCRIRLTGTWRASSLADGIVEPDLVWITSAQGAPETTVAVRGIDRARIQVHYIPAARDPQRHFRAASGSALLQLLRAVKWTTDVRDVVSSAATDVAESFEAEPGLEAIESALRKRWDDIYGSSHLKSVGLRPVGRTLEDVLQNIQATFSPDPTAAAVPLDRLSEGQRSLFYLAVVAAVFDVMGTVLAGSKHFDRDQLDLPALVVLAVEEPENHIAPHYLARIMETVGRICQLPLGQAVVTSHSPAILSRAEPEEVRALKSVSGQTLVREIPMPTSPVEAIKYVRQAVRTYPELYFSRLVVLGEGDSEEIVIPRLATAMNVRLDTSFVSVVPLGGRHVNHLWRLLNQLEVPHVTLLDLDKERHGGGWLRIKYVLEELIALGKAKELEKQAGSMGNWPVTSPHMSSWLQKLERDFDVFFSAPLDLDFLMLSSFAAAYEATAIDGPEIPEDDAKYESALEAAIAAVLKSRDAVGATYSDDEKYDMFWYRYLFLGRGKPATHVLALNRIEATDLANDAPPVLKRLIERVRALLAS